MLAASMDKGYIVVLAYISGKSRIYYMVGDLE